MNDDPGLAGSWHQSYSSEPVELNALLQMNDEQRSRWEWFLMAVENANSDKLLTRLAGEANGYSLGLRDARVISPTQCDELYSQLRSRESEAATRLGGGQ